MDKKGVIQEHSKIKLELYRLYLFRYLSVLLATPFFESIEVRDVFAGSGISENLEKGSAVIAAETIASIPNRSGKKVSLQLNDSDASNCADLKKHLTPYDFASVTCVDADKYIQTWAPAAGSHNLFFIDPHGYTQVSSKNLGKLFSTQNADFLIFVPIYHIYRFLKPSENPKDKEDSGFLAELGVNEKKRQVEAGKFYEPIVKFLEGLGIDAQKARTAGSVEQFAEMIVAALRKVSGSEYVYCQMIHNKEHNSKYALFFISHHPRGAEKFLDAQNELQKRTKEPTTQQAFDFIANDDEASILKLVQYGHAYDNAELYEQAIKWGFRPSQMLALLKRLEKSDQAKISVAELPGKKRNRGGYYIDYKYWRDRDRKITVTFRR